MSRHRLRLLVVALVAVALALVAAWLGRGFLVLDAAAARQDVALQGGVRLQHRPEAVNVRFAALLDQRHRSSALAQILTAFRAATVPHGRSLAPQTQPVDAEAEIAKLVPRLHDRGERAQAEVVLGILLAAAAGNGNGTLESGQGTGGNLLLAQALHHFQEAVRFDPTNEDAKYDLELLLQEAARTPKSTKPGKRGHKPGKKTIQPPIRQQKRPDTPQASFANPGTGY
jgi:hypothetical protein